MKEIKSFLKNGWAVYWFIAGMIFIIFAIIAAINKENDKCIACVGVHMGCMARCEVKVLQEWFKRIKELNEER